MLNPFTNKNQSKKKKKDFFKHTSKSRALSHLFVMDLQGDIWKYLLGAFANLLQLFISICFEIMFYREFFNMLSNSCLILMSSLPIISCTFVMVCQHST